MVSSSVNTHIIYLCIILAWCCSHTRSAKHDNVATGNSLKFGDYLESPNKMFQMGFFQPEKTSKAIRRYVGIWYTNDRKTIVWVANRDAPVLDSTGFLTVSEDGNAEVLDKKKKVYFNTSVEGAFDQSALMLLDSGNLVLKNVKTGETLWQSFDNPTDTFLPGMTMVKNLILTSWRSPKDPGCGSFHFQVEDPLNNTYSILNESKIYWKSGKNNTDKRFYENQIFPKASSLLSNTFIKQRPVVICNTSNVSSTLNYTMTYENYSTIENYTRLVMSYSGKIQYFRRPSEERKWVLDWYEPENACSVYQVCGVYGICDPKNKSVSCSCMKGFSDDYKNGCTRHSRICRKSSNDTFMNVPMINMDDATYSLKTEDESESRNRCLRLCECMAYSYSSQDKRGVGDEGGNITTQVCSIWESNPYNLRMHGRHNISFRVNSESEGPPSKKSERKSKSDIRDLAIAIAIAIIISTLLLSLFGYFAYTRWINRSRNNQRKYITEVFQLEDSNEENTVEVPYVEIQTIVAATDNFSKENRLGQGGFGPVYKGTLPCGQEIAVKRLSSHSRQGLQEFKNEVMLIAKLQHRNLVRLLGYSIQGEEKMLLYEHLPNRSLDQFLFDQTLCVSLDWEMRFNIIMGIARGMNYLHHDSRLRIIHRDLKTSNILLDEDMNPKISDFGLAKIIQGDDMEAVTNRVVGTFGYMSPEYALNGILSIKSDVFSFGVVVLEILSGKKNIGFYQSQSSISLLKYAWNLWIEDRPLELIDQIPIESCNSSELLKCVTVGLMCVQGDPNDRPTMTNVLGMLGGDITALPTPKEPMFITRRDHASSSSSKPETGNMLTITELDAR